MLRAVRNLVVPIGFALLAPAVHAGKIELLSKAGAESDTAINLGPWSNTNPPAVSADGRWTAFSSTAVNLVAGQQDRSGYQDVFLHDRQTGSTVLVSHAYGSDVTAARGGFSEPTSISDDGRWVVYESRAHDLVPGQVPNPSGQIFLYDRETGVNTHVSHSTAGPAVSSNGHAGHARISGDGNWIAFESNATDLLPGQSGTAEIVNVFLYERATGQTMLASRAAGTLTAANQQSDTPSISHDGRYVAFRSLATNLIAGFSNSSNNPYGMNVFLFDRVTGTTTLVSHARGSNTIGASGWSPTISPDGAAVVFGSPATNLVHGQIDTDYTWDIFLFDRVSGANLLVSHAESSPTTSAGAFQDGASVSAGGAWVAFTGFAGNPSRGQIYLFQRSDSTLTLVSRSAASPAHAANHHSYAPRLTPDGAFVAFSSWASDLVAGQKGPKTLHVYLFDRAAGALTLASGAGGSGHTAGNAMSMSPEPSADGTVVAYYTQASNLDSETADLNGSLDLALYDRDMAASTLASLHAPGLASATPSSGSTLVSASADGRYAVFLSSAVNAVPGQVDRSSFGDDVFLVDRVAGTTTLVSHAAGRPKTTGGDASLSAAISANGAYVVFTSYARDHVRGQIDTNYGVDPFGLQFPGIDVFLYDRAAGSTSLVSHAAGSSVTAGNDTCSRELGISADGRYVTFVCGATDLVPGHTGSGQNVFLYDRVANTTILVSRKAGTVARSANGASSEPVISRDGRWVGFLSQATDLVAGAIDTDYYDDVFLFDRVSGQTLLVSRASGTAATAANKDSRGISLSANGRNVVFSSLADNLVPGQTGGPHRNVFLFDRFTGVVELISREAGTATTTVAGAQDASISANGRYVAFLSSAANLVPGQTAAPGSPKMNVFVHDRATRRTELISRSALSPLQTSNDHAQKPTLSPNGRYVAFFSQATDLATGATGRDVFLVDRQLQTLERVAEGTGAYFDSNYAPPSTIPFVSANGKIVLFSSGAIDLALADFNGADDIFAYTRFK